MRDHGLKGKLSVRITVSGAGTVAAVKAREATLGDPGVAAVEATGLFKAGD